VEWDSSGFLFADALERYVDKGQEMWGGYMYVVSNRHVFLGRDEIVVRFNPDGTAPAQEYLLRLDNVIFHPDPNVDLGVVPLDSDSLTREGIPTRDRVRNGVFLKTYAAGRAMLRQHGMGEGELVHILGFPDGMVSGIRNAVIARHGSIARVGDYLAGESDYILVDGTTFQGNSGSPVISNPTQPMMVILGRDVIGPSLIGVVESYIAVKDHAVSKQTGRSVLFLDNSGLTKVIPFDFLDALVQHARGIMETKDGNRQQNQGDCQ